MGGLTVGADLTCGYKLPGVSFEGGPPEVTADELSLPVGPRVAGEATGVTPLEDLASDHRGDKQAVRWTPSRVRLGTLGHPHRRFNPLCDGTYHPGWGKDGDHTRTVAWGVRGEHSGKGVCPHVLGARAVGQGEIKPVEKQGPARLSGAQPLCVPNVRKVFMVRPYEDGVLGSLEPMPPLRQGGVDGQ